MPHPAAHFPAGQYLSPRCTPSSQPVVIPPAVRYVAVCARARLAALEDWLAGEGVEKNQALNAVTGASAAPLW